MLAQAFELITRFAGTLLYGDECMFVALFGAPAAHEAHALQALQAAYAIQTYWQNGPPGKSHQQASEGRTAVPFELAVGAPHGPSDRLEIRVSTHGGRASARERPRPGHAIGPASSAGHYPRQ